MTDENWLDFAPGGVPAGQSFRMFLSDLRQIIELQSEEKHVASLNEICFIGLVSYFEAFCKDHFVSIINIAPELLDNLKESGQDVSVDANRILAYKQEISLRIGFLLAEKYDFGSAQKINALYKALLVVSPFSKSDAKQYANILRDRNLVVHHGGTYTLTYLQQSESKDIAIGKDRAYMDSLVIPKNEFIRHLEFIDGKAKKILTATHTAIYNLVSEGNLNLSHQRKKAVDAFLWWD